MLSFGQLMITSELQTKFVVVVVVVVVVVYDALFVLFVLVKIKILKTSVQWKAVGFLL